MLKVKFEILGSQLGKAERKEVFSRFVKHNKFTLDKIARLNWYYNVYYTGLDITEKIVVVESLYRHLKKNKTFEELNEQYAGVDWQELYVALDVWCQRLIEEVYKPLDLLNFVDLYKNYLDKKNKSLSINEKDILNKFSRFYNLSIIEENEDKFSDDLDFMYRTYLKYSTILLDGDQNVIKNIYTLELLHSGLYAIENVLEHSYPNRAAFIEKELGITEKQYKEICQNSSIESSYNEICEKPYTKNESSVIYFESSSDINLFNIFKYISDICKNCNFRTLWYDDVQERSGMMYIENGTVYSVSFNDSERFNKMKALFLGNN